MREITTHKINGCNDGLRLLVTDEPGSGGANHRYEVINVSRQNTAPDADHVEVELNFQNGPIAEAGTNGITHEVLLAVIIDRLEGFQRGPFACPENQVALEHARVTQAALMLRTNGRRNRGVEGTHVV